MTPFEQKFGKFRGPFLVVGGPSSNLTGGDLVYLFRDDRSDVPIFTKNQRFDGETSLRAILNNGSTWACLPLKWVIPIDPTMGLDLLLMLYPEHTKVITKFFNDLSIESIDNGTHKV